MLGLGQLSSRLLRVTRLIQLVRQPIALFADRAQSLRHQHQHQHQLAGYLTCSELDLQSMNFRIFATPSALKLISDLGLRQGNRVA